jgi:uncharacterized protein YprB with RNaseH-like and TPR domain
MSDSESRDLRRRLSRLGRRSAPAEPEAAKRADQPKTFQSFERGKTISTSHGPAFVVERIFGLDHPHGTGHLSDLLAWDSESELAAQVARNPSLTQVPLSQMAYVDTETTGLAGGAGTLVFLVGVGRFIKDHFRLRQYLLRDPAEEEAMLEALRLDLEPALGFVTFNGRSFDIPLLEMRYVIGLRQRWQLTEWPHLDLLHPSRRLWRRQLPDCTLSTIEQRVLGIERSEEDVPGAEIPGLYMDYLRTGETGGLSRVVYHNEVDILSLVGLTTSVLERHRQPDPSNLTNAEALAVARWHEGVGRSEAAEAAYQQAIDDKADEIQIEALKRLSLQWKRQERFEEAIELWRRWSERAPDDPTPRIEMAKYFEWKTKDLEAARSWAAKALLCLSHWPEGWRRRRRQSEIEHRLERLGRKLEAGADG